MRLLKFTQEITNGLLLAEKYVRQQNHQSKRTNKRWFGTKLGFASNEYASVKRPNQSCAVDIIMKDKVFFKELRIKILSSGKFRRYR